MRYRAEDVHPVGKFTGHSVTARPKPQKLKSLTCLLDKGPVAVEERVSLDCIKGEDEAHSAYKNTLNLCVYIRRFLKMHRSGGKTNLTYAVAHRRLLLDAS